jgi:hypothetical protein
MIDPRANPLNTSYNNNYLTMSDYRSIGWGVGGYLNDVIGDEEVLAGSVVRPFLTHEKAQAVRDLEGRVVQPRRDAGVAAGLGQVGGALPELESI